VAGEDAGQCVALSVTEFGQQPTGVHEQGRSTARELSVGVQSVHAAIQREVWVMIPHLRLEHRDVLPGNVGRIGHHEIESSPLGWKRMFAEDVGLMEPHAIQQAQAARISTRHQQRRRRDVHCMDLKVHSGQGQRQGQASGTGSKIDHPASTRRNQSPGAQGEALGFRSGNQHVRCHTKIKVEEGRRTGQVLERNTAASLLQPFFKLPEGVAIRQTRIPDASAEPWDTGDGFEKQLGLKPGRIEARCGKATCGVGKE